MEELTLAIGDVIVGIDIGTVFHADELTEGNRQHTVFFGFGFVRHIFKHDCQAGHLVAHEVLHRIQLQAWLYGQLLTVKIFDLIFHLVSFLRKPFSLIIAYLFLTLDRRFIIACGLQKTLTVLGC